RNVETIVDLARARGIRPVLATLPHGTDAQLPFVEMAPEIERFAAELRAIAMERADDVVFVDLAATWPDRPEWFKDVGHLTDAGIAHKAEQIGHAVLDALRR
ncbi:MAG: hypothetical protein KDB80_00780, partial [Planctomycetes bacterium]|nr:hypothetical protein [Planctomycetota bacterium]